MKKMFLILFSILGMLVASTLSFAGSGKAIVSHWNADGAVGHRTFIHVSNITNHAIDVTVTLYGKNGAVQTQGITYANFTNSNSELAANSSGHIKIEPSSEDYGYALIEWNNNGTDTDAVALVAHGYRITSNGTSWRSDISIPINNGLPF